MLQEISYYMVFGKPVIMYVGIITFLSFLCTAMIGYMNYKRTGKIPFKWHPRMAVLSLMLAIIHAILGMLLFF